MIHLRTIETPGLYFLRHGTVVPKAAGVQPGAVRDGLQKLRLPHRSPTVQGPAR